MTRTPDEIKKDLNDALPDHVHFHKGDPEPHLTHFNYHALECLHADALAYIQQLEAGNAELLTKVERLQAERDAAVKDMHEAQGCLCLICKNHKPDPDKKKYICKAFGDYPFEDGPLICGQFEWRGVQKEE